MLIQESETMTCKKFLAALALALGVQTGASAAIITIDGDFFDISFDDSLIGLFGTPAIVGDEIKWFPSGSPGFSAKVTGADDLAVTSSTFALKITADDGYKLTGSSLTEGGDYFFFGNAVSGVSASGQLRMTSLTPAAATVIDGITPDGTFTANPALTFTTNNWSASAVVALSAPATSANVTIQNILAAWAAGAPPLQAAFIEKKEVTLSVGVVPIPEPSTWAMLGLGVGMIGFAIRRKMR